MSLLEEPSSSESEDSVAAASGAALSENENLFDLLGNQSEPALQDGCAGASRLGSTFTQEGISPLLFSHLEQSRDMSSVPVLPCGCIPDQNCLEPESDSVCRNCGCMRGPECETGDSDDTSCEDEIVRSLHSLHVSEPAGTLQQTPSLDSRLSYGYGSQPLCRTCRQEVYAPSCLDDTTVDDLVGYFDQFMYFPKPMSDMAELMYT